MSAGAQILTFPEPGADSVRVASARFVTIALAETLTGFTKSAIRTKIARGVWLEGRQWVKRDGTVLVDLRGYEQWAEAGTA